MVAATSAKSHCVRTGKSFTHRTFTLIMVLTPVVASEISRIGRSHLFHKEKKFGKKKSKESICTLVRVHETCLHQGFPMQQQQCTRTSSVTVRARVTS
uniref:Putative secreted protein synganglion overexpressed n=1 Tax=Rhipicephalus microplus TaxID=6941 RepID=A0A6M2DAL7_RHIMP